MTFRLTDAEWGFLQSVPEMDLVEIAVELDLVVPEQIDARALIEQCVPLIVDRAGAEGLPFSRYDHDDLDALDPPLRAAIARLQGLPDDASADRIVRAGQKVYRQYEKHRPQSAIALLLPSLLATVARAAYERSRQR